MRVSIARILLLICVTLAWVSQVQAGPAEPGVIVAGQSTGPVRLGGSFRALQAALGWGRPDRMHPSGSITYMQYDRHGITVAVRGDEIVLVLTTSERFRTDKGVAVGQPVSAARTAYGAGAGTGRYLWYDGIGLVIASGAGTIVRIGVYDPKTFTRAILADEVPARNVFLSARPPRYADRVDAASGARRRAATITVTLKNTSPGDKALNPNFFTLRDGDGQSHRYDPSTFAEKDACRSAQSVRPGNTGTCTIVFLLPPGQAARSIAFNDGASADEFFFQ